MTILVGKNIPIPSNRTPFDKDNYLTKLAEIEAKVGRTVKIRKGSGATAMHPLDGIPEGKPTIVIQDGGDKSKPS